MTLRILRALIRWRLAFDNLGFVPTLQIIWFRVFRARPDVMVECRTATFGTFRWNAKRDWVITHFFTPQVEIFSPGGNIEIHTIVDLGANIGTETLRFALLYPSARIVAVEAAGENFGTLAFNTRARANITPIHAAIWSHPAKLALTGDQHNSQSWHAEEVTGDTFDIRGITFEEIMAENGIGEIDILKVDIEGAEKELFSDACASWIGRVKCIVMEVPDSDAPLSTRQIFRVFDTAEYTFNTYVHGENLVLVRSDLDWKPRSIETYRERRR